MEPRDLSRVVSTVYRRPSPLVHGKPSIGRGTASQATPFFVPGDVGNNRDGEAANTS